MKAYRNIILLIALLLTVLSGMLQGYVTQRWGADDRMKQAAVRLDEFPDQVGDWKLVEQNPISDSAVSMLQCAGYLNRVYRNAATHRQLNVIVMVGPGAKMAIHRPEICYESRNFAMLGDKRMVDFTDDSSHSQSLWAIDFETNDIHKQKLRVYYGWSDGDDWQAPNRPRLAFAGERVLYKLQIAEYDPSVESQTADPALQFMNKFLPALRNCINSGQ